jgi:hypothetical protein
MIARCNIPEDSLLHTRRRENLKSQMKEDLKMSMILKTSIDESKRDLKEIRKMKQIYNT